MKFKFLILIFFSFQAIAQESPDIIVSNSKFLLYENGAFYELPDFNEVSVNKEGIYRKYNEYFKKLKVQYDTIIYPNLEVKNNVKTLKQAIFENVDIENSKKRLGDINRRYTNKYTKTIIGSNIINKETKQCYYPENSKLVLKSEDRLIICDIINDSVFYQSSVSFNNLAIKLQYNFQDSTLYYSNDSGIYYCNNPNYDSPRAIVLKPEIISFAFDPYIKQGYFLCSDEKVFSFDAAGNVKEIKKALPEKEQIDKKVWKLFNYISTNPLISTIIGTLVATIILSLVTLIKKRRNSKKAGMSNKDNPQLNSPINKKYIWLKTLQSKLKILLSRIKLTGIRVWIFTFNIVQKPTSVEIEKKTSTNFLSKDEQNNRDDNPQEKDDNVTEKDRKLDIELEPPNKNKESKSIGSSKKTDITFRQKRIAYLKRGLKKEYNLLRKHDDKLRLTNDIKEEESLKEEIKKIKNRISKSEADLKKLQKDEEL